VKPKFLFFTKAYIDSGSLVESVEKNCNHLFFILDFQNKKSAISFLNFSSVPLSHKRKKDESSFLNISQVSFRKSEKLYKILAFEKSSCREIYTSGMCNFFLCYISLNRKRADLTLSKRKSTSIFVKNHRKSGVKER